MYSMGLNLHSLSSIAVLAVIFLNLYMLMSYQNLKKYKRVHSIFLWPTTFTIYGLTLFTGVIMMAAKHLEFTLENIIMIIVSIVYITLEAKRISSLKYLSITKEHAFNAYRPIARTILQVEFFLVLLISTWMWLI